MEFLKELNILPENQGVSTGSQWIKSTGSKIDSYSPVDGKPIASVICGDQDNYDEMMNKANKAFLQWRNWTAPKRGEVVRQVGEALRKYKVPLGKLVSYEMGKSLQEGWGEVQEMI